MIARQFHCISSVIYRYGMAVCPTTGGLIGTRECAHIGVKMSAIGLIDIHTITNMKISLTGQRHVRIPQMRDVLKFIGLATAINFKPPAA